ncbi:MAG: sigma-70 family RNA polymerase sigma factor [Polyangiales bacterium]
MKSAEQRGSSTQPESTKSVNDSPPKPSQGIKEAREPHEDDALVERAQAGDRVAFQALFEKYKHRVYAVALGVVKRPEDAADVVQDAFIKVHKHLGTFQGTSSFYTWLYRIVMNLGIDHVRKHRKIVEWGDDVPIDQAAGDRTLVPKVADANPRSTIVRRELSEKIRQALDTLPEIHRAVIVLREVEGLTYEEIAEVLEVPKGTIMSRLFHARRKMQDQLQPYLEGDLDIVDEP